MKILNSILDALFPENFTCEICGIDVFDGQKLCSKCKKTVTFNDGSTCPLCGRQTGADELCLECKYQAPLFDKAVSAFVYDGGAKKLVIDFKNNKPYLKEYFADLLAKKCENFPDLDGVVCVPMTAKSFRKRGYNQSELLAQSLSKRLGVPYVKYSIEKVKNTAGQKTLTKSEREQNLKGCFIADKDLVAGKNLLVVDDVLTTGATADAVCKELKKKGALKVYLATVASVTYDEIYCEDISIDKL